MAAMLLGIVLSLRLIAAPFIIASPAPGIMAICSGGHVVYVSMADGQPVQDNEGSDRDPCPFFGIVSALVIAEEPQITLNGQVTSAQRFVLSSRSPHASIWRDNQSRAPPVSI